MNAYSSNLFQTSLCSFWKSLEAESHERSLFKATSTELQTERSEVWRRFEVALKPKLIPQNSTFKARFAHFEVLVLRSFCRTDSQHTSPKNSSGLFLAAAVSYALATAPEAVAGFSPAAHPQAQKAACPQYPLKAPIGAQTWLAGQAPVPDQALSVAWLLESPFLYL